MNYRKFNIAEIGRSAAVEFYAAKWLGALDNETLERFLGAMFREVGYDGARVLHDALPAHNGLLAQIVDLPPPDGIPPKPLCSEYSDCRKIRIVEINRGAAVGFYTLKRLGSFDEREIERFLASMLKDAGYHGVRLVPDSRATGNFLLDRIRYMPVPTFGNPGADPDAPEDDPDEAPAPRMGM